MKNITRCLLVVVWIVAAILLLNACRKNGGSEQEKASIPVSLRLKWIYDPGFAGEMVAARVGFFQQNGLTVDLKPGGFEADPIKLVASGSDTFGVTGADSFLLARSKGIPIVAFAAGYLETPVVFYVRADSSINTPLDFVGKKVGVQAGQDTETVYAAMLKANNVSRSRIKEIPVKYDFTPFLTGQLDVWPGYAATQSYILDREKINYRMIKPSEFGVSYLGTVYFARADYIAEHPKEVQSFVDSLIQGWEFTYSNREKAISMISSFDTKALTPELVGYNLDRQKPFILPSGAKYCDFSLKSWQQLNQTLVELKLLDAPVDLKAAVTDRFLVQHYGARATR